MEHLSQEIGESSETFKRLSQKVWESFNDSFWYEEEGYLYDYVDGEEHDTSMRPNQIFAISLTFPVLARERWHNVMRIVEKNLLTPYGLRTLAPQDPRYRGRCVGNIGERDASYHNGTVWTWLTGPYITAYIRSGGRPNSLLILNVLKAFCHHLFEAGLGTVSEIFDGDAPHEPRGCIAQAWSVGELLRACREDLAMNPRGV
jgi:glycogen debranching enzyme